MISFCVLVYIILVQTGVISEASSVFDVGEKKVDIVTNNPNSDSLNIPFMTIEQWLIKLGDYEKCSTIYNINIEEMKKQHPLYSYLELTKGCFSIPIIN